MHSFEQLPIPVLAAWATKPPAGYSPVPSPSTPMAMSSTFAAEQSSQTTLRLIEPGQATAQDILLGMWVVYLNDSSMVRGWDVGMCIDIWPASETYAAGITVRMYGCRTQDLLKAAYYPALFDNAQGVWDIGSHVDSEKADIDYVSLTEVFAAGFRLEEKRQLPAAVQEAVNGLTRHADIFPPVRVRLNTGKLASKRTKRK